MSLAFIALSIDTGHVMLAHELAQKVKEALQDSSVACDAEHYYDETDEGTEYGAKIVSPRTNRKTLHQLLVAALPALREQYGYLRLEVRG